MKGAGVIALNSKDNAKMEKIHKLAVGGSMSSVRKRLGDITNLNQSDRVFKPLTDHGNPSTNVIPSSSARDYNQLLTENTTLMRMLAEKTQIIEHNNLELQKLQLAFQKSQQQNWQLAQAHSQMLAELNLGKDRLKLLQHELSCTVATLKAKDLKLEQEKEDAGKLLRDKINIKKNKQRNCDKITGDEPYLAANEKSSVPNRKRSSKKISLCAIDTTLQAETSIIGKDLNKRRSTRSQSGNFEPQTCKPELLIHSNAAMDEDDNVGDKHKRSTRAQSSNLRPQACGTELPASSNGPESGDQINAKKLRSTQRQTNNLKTQAHGFQLPISMREETVNEDQPILPGSAAFSRPHPLYKEANEEHQGTEDGCAEIKAELKGLPDNQNDSAPDVQKSSIARPLRRAATGVSYKELPVNIKMRRP